MQTNKCYLPINWIGPFALSALLLAGSSAFALQVTAAAEVELPKENPPKPWDKDARIGVHLDETQADIAAFEYWVPTTYGGIDAQYLFPQIQSSGRLVSKVTLNLGNALKSKLDKTLSGFFPRSVRVLTLSSEPELSLDALIAISYKSEWYMDKSGPIAGLTVQVVGRILDSAGKELDRIQGVGASKLQRAFTRAGACEEAGEIALGAALDRFVTQLRASTKLSTYLETIAKMRAGPAGLEITGARLDDAGSLIPNQRLDAGEEVNIIVQTANRGPGPAYEVTLRATSKSQEISSEREIRIGDLGVGEEREVSVPVSASLNAIEGTAYLEFSATDKRGHLGKSNSFPISVAALTRPQLEIVNEIAWNDDGGRTEGDGDHRPSNGETLEAVVFIKNTGVGDAAGVTITASSGKAGVEILDPRVAIRRIGASRLEEARVLLRISPSFSDSDLGLIIEAVDGRGPSVARADGSPPCPVLIKQALIEVVAVKVFDGHLTGSTGNRDGRIQSGEKVEVSLSVANRGGLVARDARIEITTDDPTLVVRPSILALGDLLAYSAEKSVSFSLEVPRTFGHGQEEKEVYVKLLVTQTDFRAKERSLPFRIHALHADLQVEFSSEVERGVNELSVELRNRGNLRAEGVALAITASREAEILDDNWLPVSEREFFVGSLPPNARSAKRKLLVRVPGTTTAEAIALNVRIMQRDMAPLQSVVKLKIQQRDLSIAADQPQASLPAGKPKIIFLKPTETQIEKAEEELVLEIEARAEPRLVRLLVNHSREIWLTGRYRASRASEGRRVFQYAEPIKLEFGENKLVVSVTTEEGVFTDSLTLYRREVGRFWVVAIGINEYSDTSIEGLRFAASDAQAVRDYYRDIVKLPEEQVMLLKDGEATRWKIKELLGSTLLRLASNPEDTVIIYFAGHGEQEPLPEQAAATYLLPQDAVRANLFSSAISMLEIGDIFRRLRPKRVLLLLDHCFSGAAVAGDRGVSVASQVLGDWEVGGEGRVVFAASSGHGMAKEELQLGHGVFTFFLLEGLRKGKVRLGELTAYVTEKVVQYTEWGQEPMIKGVTSPNFLLVREPKREMER